MSTPDELEGPRLIAGEPATDTASKPVPALTARQNSTSPQSTSPARKPMVLAVLQVFMLMLALAGSSYAAYTVATWTEESDRTTELNELLVRTEGRDADGLCAEGGSLILIGVDHNLNQYLDGEEVTSTTNLCHGERGNNGVSIVGATGPSSWVETETLPLGNETCPSGGSAISTGVDENANGYLDSDEVLEVQLLCNGAVGPSGANGGQGSNGASGVNGAPALVEQRTPLASVCSSGISIKFGIDDGMGEGQAFDGMLHADEVRSSLNLCSQPLNAGPVGDFTPGITNGVNSGCDQLAWMPQSSVLITAGSDGSSGCELWSKNSTGTASMLVDLNPTGDSLPGRYTGFIPLNNNGTEAVVFDADDGMNGRHLWITDGTAAGTQRLNGPVNTNVNGPVQSVAWLDGVVMLNGIDALLWTNGSSTIDAFDHPSLNVALGANERATLTNLTSYQSSLLTVEEGWLWFSAKSSAGIEPYALNENGMLRSWDLAQGDSTPSASVGVSGGLVTVADNGQGRQLVRLNHDSSHLWLTAMSHSGTGNPTQYVGEHLGLHLLGDVIVFDALTSGVDPQVWSHHLTEATTSLLSETILAPGDLAGGVVHQDRLWFDCVAPSIAQEVCSTDGTASGTRTETDLRAGSASALVRGFATSGEVLFMIASGQIDGVETGSCLWVLNEASAPQMVHDPWSGLNNNSNAGTYGGLVVSEHQVFFIANDGTTGHEWQAFSHGSLNGEWLIWPA